MIVKWNRDKYLVRLLKVLGELFRKILVKETKINFVKVLVSVHRIYATARIAVAASLASM